MTFRFSGQQRCGQIIAQCVLEAQPGEEQKDKAERLEFIPIRLHHQPGMPFATALQPLERQFGANQTSNVSLACIPCKGETFFMSVNPKHNFSSMTSLATFYILRRMHKSDRGIREQSLGRRLSYFSECAQT